MPITEVPSPAKEDKHEQIKQKEKEDSIETSFESIDSRRKEEMRRRRAKFDMQKLKYHKIKEKNDHLHSQLQQILRSKFSFVSMLHRHWVKQHWEKEHCDSIQNWKA